MMDGVTYIYNWRAGANQPSRTTGTIFLYIYYMFLCRAGGSQPSRTTGTIFLYYIIYMYSTCRVGVSSNLRACAYGRCDIHNYIIGEREGTNLVVRLARFFYIILYN